MFVPVTVSQIPYLTFTQVTHNIPEFQKGPQLLPPTSFTAHHTQAAYPCTSQNFAAGEA
jgi:hypothetical protein